MNIKKNVRSKMEFITGYYFVLPALIYMLIFTGYPLVYNFILSFQNMNVMTIKSGAEFVGLQAYRNIFSDDLIFLTFKNTLNYTLWSLLFQFTIGMAFAILFSKDFFLSKPLRGFMVVSWMMPLVVTSLLFKFMLSESSGILNDILIMLSIIKKPIPWLINPDTAMWGLIITNTWVGIPFNMILLTTGLSSIPGDVYESASIDGANGPKKFFYITLPLLKPAILSILVMGFIYTFKVFDLVLVMTSGGPVNATEVLSTYSYRLAFKNYNFSEGAAVANILFICLFIVSLIYLRLINKEEAM